MQQMECTSVIPYKIPEIRKKKYYLLVISSKPIQFTPSDSETQPGVWELNLRPDNVGN